ncbi:MAG: S-layer homology domain-containing protein [Clostridia bacterium]|nr:S-layer homology domain-containing protein [Clostridia bacterium]
MYKKIITVLAMVMIFTGLTGYAASENSKLTQSENELLEYLGIRAAYEDGEYHGEDIITRAQMCKTLSVLAMKGMECPRPSQSLYNDVSVDYWASGEINTLSSLGYVSGFENGIFMPEEEALYEQAIAVTVSLLGYADPAKESGWPEGYMSQGSALGLTKGVGASIGEAITVEQFERIIFNALKAEPMTVSFEPDRTLQKQNETLMSLYFDIEKINGRVTADPKTGLFGSDKMPDGKIEIDGRVYQTDKSYSLLGRYVTGYAECSEDEDKLISLNEDEDKKSLKISSTMLKSEDGCGAKGFANPLENPVITYRTENGRTKNVRIEKSAQIIKNGKVLGYAADVPNNSIVPSTGSVHLLANKNGEYDVVYITEYEYFAVGSVSVSLGRISDKFTNRELDLEDVNYTIIQDNKPVEIDSLKELDILAVAKDDDVSPENIDIIKLNKTVTGNVETISDTTVTIDGIEYDLADEILSFDGITLGCNGTFYLGIDGEIVAAKITSQNVEKYAIFIRLIYEEYEQLSMKLFTQDGEMNIFKCSDKLKINDEKIGDFYEYVQSGAMRSSDGKYERQLVKYRLNQNGEITKFYTLSGNNIKQEASELYIYCNKWTIGSRYRANDYTVAFGIPEELDAKDSEYEVGRFTSMGLEWKTLDVYDVREDYTAGCVVFKESDSDNINDTFASKPIAVVKSLGKAVNTDDVIVYQIEVMTDGKVSRYSMEEDLEPTKDTSDGEKLLSAGDVIQFNLNSEGEIDYFLLLLDNEYAGEDYTETWYHRDSGIIKTEAANSVLYTVNCRIKEVIGDIVLAEINGVTKPYSTKNCMVYKYDSDARHKLSMGYVGDIVQGAHVFLRVYKSELQEVVVYND